MVDKKVTTKLDLPDETVEFLKDLRAKDIEDLRSTMELVNTLKTVTKFVRWTIYFVMATFMAIIGFWDGLAKVKVILAGLFK